MAQKDKDTKLIITTGKRKPAVARVFLYEEKGEILINDKPIDTYFVSAIDKLSWMKPFHLVGFSHPESNFSATIKIFGSGKSAQLGALVHGFAKALASRDEEHANILRKAGLITRDPRMVERKKPNLRKARKAHQYSKR